MAHKSDPRAESRGKSFGTMLWHHVQKYCCLGVSFAHAQVRSNSSSYHIRGNEMNCVGSSEYMTVFTPFSRASFLNDADETLSVLIRTFFPKIFHFIVILPYYIYGQLS